MALCIHRMVIDPTLHTPTPADQFGSCSGVVSFSHTCFLRQGGNEFNAFGSMCPLPKLHVAKPPRTATLLFDGEFLYWQEPGNSTKWPAYSGTKAYWKHYRFSEEDQKAADAGPIPEGTWLVALATRADPNNPKVEYGFQRRQDTTLWNQAASIVHRGAWPGGYSSWGDSRIMLEPQGDVQTTRSGFSIHGGTDPGSIGCIDLTGNMSIFASYFLDYGKDMYLTVRYNTALTAVREARGITDDIRDAIWDR